MLAVVTIHVWEEPALGRHDYARPAPRGLKPGDHTPPFLPMTFRTRAGHGPRVDLGVIEPVPTGTLVSLGQFLAASRVASACLTWA